MLHEFMLRVSLLLGVSLPHCAFALPDDYIGNGNGEDCPTYESIRQPAVAAGVWSNQRWSAGPWYVQATNEHAQPNSTLLSCPCSAYESTVPGPSRFGNDSYSSTYTSACGDQVFGFHNLTIHLEGFWNDTSSPALHWENYKHAKHYGPTMIYDAEVGTSGDYEWCAVYACEGPPTQSKIDFSWQLLSRSRVVKSDDVQRWVAKASGLGLDLAGLEFAEWEKCESWRQR